VLRHEIEKHLKAIGIEVGEFIKKVFSSRRFDHSIERGSLKLPLHFAFGFDPSGCDFSATEGLESDAGFIFTQESDLPTHPHHSNGHPSQHC
jgi:hypothetical protein